MNLWFQAYEDAFGYCFNVSVSGKRPFHWVISESLHQIVTKLNISQMVPNNSATFDALLGTWSQLTPLPGTLDALRVLSSRYLIAPLSNGDAAMLRNATSVFLPSVNMSYIFSSDYPVECFKPEPDIYAQVPHTHTHTHTHKIGRAHV